MSSCCGTWVNLQQYRQPSPEEQKCYHLVFALLKKRKSHILATFLSQFYQMDKKHLHYNILLFLCRVLLFGIQITGKLNNSLLSTKVQKYVLYSDLFTYTVHTCLFYLKPKIFKCKFSSTDTCFDSQQKQLKTRIFKIFLVSSPHKISHCF